MKTANIEYEQERSQAMSSHRLEMQQLEIRLIDEVRRVCHVDISWLFLMETCLVFNPEGRVCQSLIGGLNNFRIVF